MARQLLRRGTISAAVLVATALTSLMTAPGAGAETRTAGLPASANGASSSLLDLARPSDTSVEVTLTVRRPPATADLHFWALQVLFLSEGGRYLGSAHVGLQWHPDHPGSTAVNYGGYDVLGQELLGTTSELSSATGNPNTRDFRWEVGHPYRLSIRKVDVGWAASVTDEQTGAVTQIRTLAIDAPRIGGSLVFSEVFAPCDAPSTVVRWSSLASPVAHARYQSLEHGGCTNTDQRPDGDGVLHVSNGERTVADGTSLLYRPRPTPGFVKGG